MSSTAKLALTGLGVVGIIAAIGLISPLARTQQLEQPEQLDDSSEPPQRVDINSQDIASFDSATEAAQWRNVDDTVMGGVSQSSFSVLPEGYGRFSGTLSLENNGGFTSVRRPANEMNFADAGAISLSVRGDGRTYQFRLKMSDSNRDISYRSEFTTTADWQTVRLPIGRFEPVFRGRVVTDAPALDLEKVEQMGFLLASKDSGDFWLEVDWIQVEP